MDPELEAIRAKRLAQMKQGAGMAGLPAGLPSGLPQMQKQEQEKPEEDEMRRTILASILDNSARERLARISIVKQDKARQVEEMLIRMAQSGQIRGKVNEQQLIDLLGQIAETKQAEPKITFNRRRFDDSDDEDFGL